MFNRATCSPLRHQSGFNLIEIMFALLLLGLVISISVETSAGDLAAYNRAKDSTMARWVAANQLAEFQLELAGKFPPAGKRSGESDMGKTRWQWRQEVLPTNSDDLRRVQVSVFRKGNDKDMIAMQVGFIANPNPKPRPKVRTQ
ncbi:MAG: type II secretion system minor pseudopilin GspI [Gammaproteobacteria bacterium]|nr:type II secretion system minor pseudopilin GspI [Gammaproteobacteria bacterium]MBU1724994.1 type II secretion system minor pseudopilin GspI [Gammaproteobacteria bacterium]MBU2005080.1 type II secretion system minor pseudopilin GspI [Gammaproteobacteria bacterium]